MRVRLSLLSAFFSLYCFPISVSAQAGGSVVFVGTEVLPLGGATLSIGSSLAASAAPMSNRLYVGNLSFSGSDGFSMQIGGGSGALIGFMDTAPTFPVGGTIEFHASNNVGILPCIRVAKTGAGMITIDPDFAPLGATSYRVEVWNGGVPFASNDATNGNVGTPLFPTAFAIDLESVIAPLPELPLPATSAFALSDGFVLRWGTDVTFTDDAGSSLGTGDELRMYPEGGVSLGSVVTIDVTVAIPSASPPYTMIVDDLAQQQFGRLHRGGGSATIRCQTGGAPTGLSTADVLANHREISADLLPGVVGSLRANMSGSGDFFWDLKGGFLAGDLDEFSVTAELLAGGQGVVGKVTSLHNGSHWNVTPDFSGSGSPDARVELFDASGNLLGINPCVTEFTVMTTDWATETGVEDDDDLALVLGFATPVPVDIGTGPIMASRIKMHSNASKKHKFFAIVDRSNMSMAGGQFSMNGANNVFDHFDDPVEVTFRSKGSAYGKRSYDCLLLNNMGTTGSDGVSIEPCVLTGETPPDRFGVEWMPLGPPDATIGQTDWDFLTRHAGQPGPVQAMSIHMESNGSMVGVMAGPGPVQTPEFRVVLKKAGQTVATFGPPPDDSMPFAELPDWPIAIGYQLLAYDDQPWSMWIDLGYEMDVTIPGLATPRNGAAAMPSVPADLIEVIAQNVPNPGPPDATVLSGKFAGIPFIVLRDRRPTTSGVGATTPFVRSVLRPAYPNPFNPQTTLSFDLATSGEVSLKVYAVDGSYVATVHAGSLRAGTHAYPWNGVDQRGQTVASGVYFAELRTPDGARQTKLNLLK